MSERADLPQGWAWTHLKTVADIVTGGTPSKLVSGNYGDAIPFVRAGDLDIQGPIDTTAEYLSAKGARESRVLPAGSIMVACIGSIGKVGVSATNVVTNQQINSLVLTDELESRFVYYYCRSSYFQGLLQSGTSATTVRILNKAKFSLLPIPIAPINEQHRIVQKIEELFSELDAGVAALERVRANLKRYRAAVLKAAVEGALTAAWRAEHPDVEPAGDLLQRILHERYAAWEQAELARYTKAGKTPPKGWQDKYKEPVAPDTTDLPELSQGWCWATIAQLAAPEPRSIQSGPFGSALLHSEFQQTGILVIGIDNVLDGKFSIGSQHRISMQKYQQLQKFTARPLDVLITVMATVGRCCVVPQDLETAIITKHVYRISADQALVNPHYLTLCLRGGDEVRQQLFGQVQGQTRPGINGEILKRIAIPLPSLAEQEQIVAEVERRVSVADDAEARVAAGLKRAARLRQSILKQAFAGQLAPQDPNDEPASALLERIDAKRGHVVTADKVACGAGRAAPHGTGSGGGELER